MMEVVGMWFGLSVEECRKMNLSVNGHGASLVKGYEK